MGSSRTLVGLGGPGGGAGLDWIYKEIHPINSANEVDFVIYADSLADRNATDSEEDEILTVDGIVGKNVLEIVTWSNTIVTSTGAIRSDYYSDKRVLKHDEDNEYVSSGFELSTGTWRWELASIGINERIYLTTLQRYELYVEPHTGRIYFIRTSSAATSFIPAMKSITIRGA